MSRNNAAWMSYWAMGLGSAVITQASYSKEYKNNILCKAFNLNVLAENKTDFKFFHALKWSYTEGVVLFLYLFHYQYFIKIFFSNLKRKRKTGKEKCSSIPILNAFPLSTRISDICALDGWINVKKIVNANHERAFFVEF